jgi:soluble lytic murein transglycosylase
MKKKHRSASVLIVLAVLIVAAAVLWQYGYTGILKMVYPRRYASYVEKYAGQYGVDPALIYAVIKNESSFNPQAISKIGAQGLMQLTPETFSWAQRKTSVKRSLTQDDLYNPEINIQYGTVVLAQLLSEFKREDTALAAYHAGRTNVKRWLANSKYSADGRTLTYIPFDDTRSYVAKVLKTEAIYKELYYKS